MRVLLLGAAGNLGLRLIPAILAHGHSVVAYVRSVSKLQSLIPTTLFERIETYEGDALDTQGVENAIRFKNIDAIMNTAGTRLPGTEQVLGKIATSVTSATIRVGKDRKTPLRAWLIGGMGSLEYPGSGGWQIQDYMPLRMTRHHKETEAVMKAIPTADVEWTLLCVAFMKPESEKVELLQGPRHHSLTTSKGVPPEWQDSWFKYVPFLGSYLNIFLNITAYTTKLEDVADLIAEDFDKGDKSEFIGELVGMKDTEKSKSS